MFEDVDRRYFAIYRKIQPFNKINYHGISPGSLCSIIPTLSSVDSMSVLSKSNTQMLLQVNSIKRN